MDTASVRCQIVLAEDNPADVGLVRQALRDHDVHCDLRVISDGEAVVTFIDGLDLGRKTSLSGSSPAGHAPAEA